LILTPIPLPGEKALVVGAAGQVGSAIVSALAASALPAGRKPTPGGALSIDLAALAAYPALASALLAPLDLSAVYCVGGATDVERCESDPAWANETNHLGPLALARAARHVPFVFFSTDYVFDGREAPGSPAGPYASAGPYSEDAPTHPLSVYGRSKLLGEQAILDAHPSALIVRTTTVFGPDPQRKNFLYTLQRLLSAGTPMRVPTDQISTPTYNQDLARATIALVQAGATGVFHIAGPDLCSRYDFALLAAGILGLDVSHLQPVITAELNQRAARPLASGLRTGKLLATLPSIHMRGKADAVRDWQQNTGQDLGSDAT
jgi:dTDP-4-dehydrorhamnose reductase